MLADVRLGIVRWGRQMKLLMNRRVATILAAAMLVTLPAVTAGPAYAGARDTTVAAASGPRYIVNNKTGLCLTVHGASRAKGAKVDLYRCVGATNQRWTMITISGFWFELVNQNSGLCLDVLGNSMKNGGLLGQWNCSGALNQRFSFNSTSGSRFTIGAAGSRKYIQPKYHDGRANNPVHQWSSHGTWAVWHH
jgi:ricin-type beta-trefoil lectin protein